MIYFLSGTGLLLAVGGGLDCTMLELANFSKIILSGIICADID